MNTYTGYIYLWFDTKATLFYLGGHHGRVDDYYICSSKTMLRAYKKRPETFRLRILEYVNGTTKDLRVVEQRWLNMIKPTETLITENVRNNTHRYYNVKLSAAGGNGKGTNKGNKNCGGWNRGSGKPKSAPRIRGGWNREKWVVIDSNGNHHEIESSYIFARENDISWSNLYYSYTQQKVLTKGKLAGWRLIKEPVL